jgi:multidrug efflux system membrane fusion protein
VKAIRTLPARWLKILLPVAVLAASAAGAWAIATRRPSLEAPPPAGTPPLVRIVAAHPEKVRLDVHSQGLVAARTEIDLVAEVSGKVVRVHPAFAAGGFFAAGDVLLAIDPRDYDHAIVKAEAEVVEARRAIAQEQAAVVQARGEWRALGEGRPTPLALHEPQLAEAKARLKAAEATLAEARLRRSRCELRAPFAGRVREIRAGLGQFLAAGDKPARLYSIDAAEIRLPVAPDQLPYLDLPRERPGQAKPPLGPGVTLTARLGGESRQWRGRIVRTEGAVEESTGLLYLVAEVREPYSRDEPLWVGSFVQADIEGREQSGIFVLPAGALDASGEALLVDGAGRLRRRRLEVLRSEPDRVLVRSGLAPGERVVVAGVDVPVEGMAVRVEAVEDGPRASRRNGRD